MKKLSVALLGTLLIFLFLYSWYLPENHATSLVLDLSTNTTQPGILLSDSIKIEQSFLLDKNSNRITIPLQLAHYTDSGIVQLEIRRTDTNAVIATNQAEIKNSENGEIQFNFPHLSLASQVPYIAQLSFSSIREQDAIRLPYAFGKYANLSGTVTQYTLKNTHWKQTDVRHGNIAMQFYSSPQETNLLLAFKAFALPAIALIIVWIYGIKVFGKERNKKIIFRAIRWKEYILAGCLSVLLATLATIPLYVHLAYISNHGDINRGLVYTAIAQRDILLGHLPQWNQYICGGSPLWGDLESWFLQPLFLLTIPFSAVIAMKCMYTLCLAVACTGFYALGRRILQYHIAGAAMFALIMAFGGYISAHLAEGYYVWVASAWIPWFLLFGLMSVKNMKWAGLAGLMLAFMFLSGSMHMVVFSILFLSIVLLFPMSDIKISRRYSILFLIGCFFLIVSAAKLLPVFSLLTANISREGFAPSIQELPNMLLGRGALPPLMGNGEIIRWGEFDAYIGYAALALACIGGVIWKKEIWQKYKAYIIASISILCLSFILLPITHGFLSHITDLFRMPSRMMLFAIFFIAVLAACAIDKISELKNLRFVIYILCFLIAIDLVSNDFTLFSRTFTVPLPELHQETKFQRVSHAYTSDDETYYRAVYIDFLENRGTNDVCRFYQAGPFTRSIDSTDPRTPSIGEVALQDENSGTVSYTMNNQSEYHIHVDITSPTIVLINQNYYPGWKTNTHAMIKNAEGRIGIPLAPGTYDFSLRYEPYVVYWGILISMIGIVLGVLLLL